MKRILDLFLAILILLIILPFFILIALTVFIDVKGPFFKQKRIGLNEKVFSLYKFKSMKDINENKQLKTNSERITKIGRFIRNYSLDELPSLINIIKGEMSFIGPRPLLVEYLDYYKLEHKTRHNVRPGLTGLAQINGRNNTTWQKRLDYDIEYVENRSFKLDMKILGLTFLKVIKKENVESDVDLSIIRLDQDKSYKNNI
jgi:lipopolysaccharide/colanic/teichoic acid biosynthesis glycosyltransferase